MEAGKMEKFAFADRGNGLRASATLRAGELLYRSEPLAYTVSKGRRGVVCECCLLGKEKLLRCSQCQVAKYCSAECQKKAWPDHKRECKCLRNCQPRYPPDSVRLLGRVLVKLMDQKPSASEELYTFYDLESNINKLTEDKKEGLRQLAMTFQHFMKEEIQDTSQLPPSFDVFEAFAKVICNSFTICDAEMQEVGVGLYPSMSLLNHSCDPNCSIVFSGPCLFLRAVRDIEVGEELTICYLDMLMTSEERRKQLRDQYCFECDCIRCQTQDKDAEMLTGDQQVWKDVQEALKKLEELKVQQNWEEALATCQAIIRTSSEWLPDTNIYQLKVLDCALDTCIHLGLWEEALLYGTRTLEPYRMFFPGNHPVRGVQVMKVGKLQLHQGLLPQARKNLRLAFDILRVTHGREHRLIEDLILLLEECEASISMS
ncbi:PREDICTED: histone-lysine N-methyltransferase SMYD3 [Elephantulus edwardii]|uniref:histone-lysine N-methyltransferase SMYD3 n=1 Tax=Elephantulus edwardii TaxID=28737 RepID=UPI0003F088BA|nr:PREDICTED: histone-lysine N-methyltransferase SMYD3 [Elephantulus edwardii]